jgi:hypothetical protein
MEGAAVHGSKVRTSAEKVKYIDVFGFSEQTGGKAL